MNGILLVNKPKGWTSHDVVAKVRGRLKREYHADKRIKVGHCGTLDPMATGVLPICVGNSTKIVDVFSNANKQYRAILKLGVVTDTQDLSDNAEIIMQNVEIDVDEERIREVVASFVGDISQVPPMYSAIKKDGKKLYELAREGIEIEREARNVKIFDIKILGINEDLVEILVDCSKGTYIRTLCDDIGKELGCGAALAELERKQVGGFGIDECQGIDEGLRFVGTAVTIGCFDGVHVAHQELIKKVVDSGHKSVVFSINTGREELTEVDQKAEIVSGLGVEIFISKNLDEMKAMSALKFFNKYILGLNAKLVVVGYSFKFGKNREGDVALLQKLCDDAGINLFVLPEYVADGETVSSTRIRELVKKNEFDRAEKLLGRRIH